jgi:hypothetical protein
MEGRVRLAWGEKRARHVAVRALDLLQADDVPRLDAGEPAREAFALGRAQTVDVERDDAHAGVSKSAAVYRALYSA